MVRSAPVGIRWRVFSSRRPSVSGHSRAKRSASIVISSSERLRPLPPFTVSVVAPARRRTRTSVPSSAIARYPCSIRVDGDRSLPGGGSRTRNLRSISTRASNHSQVSSGRHNSGVFLPSSRPGERRGCQAAHPGPVWCRCATHRGLRARATDARHDRHQRRVTMQLRCCRGLPSAIRSSLGCGR